MANREETTRSLVLANSMLDDVNEQIHPITEIDSRLAPSILAALNAALNEVDRAERLTEHPKLIVTTEQGEVELTSTDLRATALLFRGIIHGMVFDDLKSAIHDAEESVRLAPEFANAFHLLGVFYFDAGKKRRAIRAIDEAISLQPDNLDFQKAKATWQQLSREHAATAVTTETLGAPVSLEKASLRNQLAVNIGVLAIYVYALSTTPDGQLPPGWALLVMMAWAFFAFRWIMSTCLDFFHIMIFASFRDFGIKYAIGTVFVFVLGIIILPLFICLQMVQYIRLR